MGRLREQSAAIVIPTGRNGFCCIVPCALLCALYSAIGMGALVLFWRIARHRFGHWQGPRGVGR